MADNDVITQRLEAQEVKILSAIGEVKQEVNHIKTKVTESAVIIARLDERQIAQRDRMDGFEDTVKSLRTWDKAIGAIGAIIGPAIAFLVSSFKRNQ